MNRLTIIFCCFLPFFGMTELKAQEDYHYSFEVDSRAYQNLVNDTLLIWDEKDFFKSSIHADITYFKPATYFPRDGIGYVFDQDGVINYDESISAGEKFDTTLLIAPCNINTHDTLYGRLKFLSNKPSFISYKIDSVDGERVLTIQFRNLSYKDSLPNDSINFQVHLYERGSIEYHYGPTYLQEVTRVTFRNWKAPNVFFGVYTTNYGFDEVYNLLGNPANPSTESGNAFTNSMDALPATGQIYRFKYLGDLTGVIDAFVKKSALKLGIYDGILQVNSQIEEYADYRIYDMSGKLSQEGSIASGKSKIDVQGLASGMYVFQALFEHGAIQTAKFYKP